MKYKVGDKVLMEMVVDEIRNNDYAPIWVSLEREDTTDGMWLKEEQIDKYAYKGASKTYEDGLADAWKVLKHIQSGELSKKEIMDIWGMTDLTFVNCFAQKYTPQEALKILEAYEESKVIKAGDEIVVVGHAIKGYVIDKSKECEDCYVVLITNYKDLHTAIYNKTVIKKTGRHIDITQILEQIRGE